MFFFWLLSIITKYLTFLLLYLGYSLTHLIYIFPSIKYKLPPYVAYFWPSAVVSGGDLPFAGHTMKVCADNECCGWWSRLIYLLALRLKVLRILPLFRSGTHTDTHSCTRTLTDTHAHSNYYICNMCLPGTSKFSLHLFAYVCFTWAASAPAISCFLPLAVGQPSGGGVGKHWGKFKVIQDI